MKFLRVLCVVFGLVLPALALDREAFTFTRYELEIRVEPEQQRLGVRGKVILRNDSDAPQKNLVLQISSSLNWSSIQLEGKPVEFTSQLYTSDIDHTGALTEAIVDLPRPISPKQAVELEVGYEGVISQNATRLTRIGAPADVAMHSEWDQISASFTAVRGIGYVAWYPIATDAASLSEGNDVFEAIARWKKREAQAEIEIDLCAPKTAFQSASLTVPEMLMNEPPHTEGRAGGFDGSICSGHSYRALGNVVPVFVIRDYTPLVRANLEVYFLPGHKSAADDFVSAVEETAPLVDKWFGEHREKSEVKATVIELPDADAAPFESANMLLTPLGGKDATLLLSAIDLQTRIAFPSPRTWIHDGVPGFAQLSFLQERAGRGAVIAYLQNHRSAFLNPGKGPSRATAENHAAENSLINASDEFFVQAKAVNVWWMLRDMLGENALNAALHNYNANDDNRADYMQKLIEKQAHRDLEWFFDDWAYRDRGLPDFRIVSVYPRQLVSGGYMMTVTVENLGSASAEVPVTLHIAEREASERLIVPAKSQASVRIQAVALPNQVTVNDGSVPETNTDNNVYKIESTDK